MPLTLPLRLGGDCQFSFYKKHSVPVLFFTWFCGCGIHRGMSWQSIYQNMAFSPYKTEMAAYHELRDSVKTIYYFIQGQAKVYELQDALRHIDYVSCSQQVRRETKRIRDCMYLEGDVREEICKDAFGAIVRYLENQNRQNK